MNNNNDIVLVSLDRLRQELGEIFDAKISSYLESITESVNNLTKEEDPDSVFLDVNQACEMLRISKTTLWRLEMDGELKPARNFGKKKLYLKSDVIRAGRGL